jgi:hypothetical protein
MAQQFTPAPWTAWTSGRYVEVLATEGHSMPVVQWSGFARSHRPLAEQSANAFLIAAAPELLDFTAMVAERDDDKAARALVAKATKEAA